MQLRSIIIRAGALLSAGSLLTPAPLIAAPPADPLQIDVAAGTAAQDAAVARITTAIVEYTRWPAPTNPIELCVVGSASHAGRLDGITVNQGTRVVRRAIAANAGAAANCDVLYFGRVDPVAARQMIAGVRGRAVLTIAENDPQCRSQAMFCLLVGPAAVSFRLNLDAVSRSGVRVDPRVLRLSREGL